MSIPNIGHLTMNLAKVNMPAVLSRCTSTFPDILIVPILPFQYDNLCRIELLCLLSYQQWPMTSGKDEQNDEPRVDFSVLLLPVDADRKLTHL